MAVMQLQNIFHLDRQSAVSDQECGEPVYPSGPSTGCEPTPLATDGRKPSACPPNLPLCASPTSQSKTGREFEGRALISAAGGAVPLTSLDSKENNRDSPRDAHRINQCGKLTLRGVKPDSSVAKFFKLPCKCWGCPRCGPRKARRYRHLIRQAAERYKLQHQVCLHSDARSEEAQWGSTLHTIHQ